MADMRLFFAWSRVTGYMGACWRALQARGCDVRCFSAVSAEADASRAFDLDACLRDVDVRFVPRDESFDRETVRQIVLAFKPDVLFITGWSIPINRFLATDSTFRAIPKVLEFDMPWAFSPRKFAARIVLRPYLRHFDAAFVSGASAARYARWLGFGGARPIYTGLYATDMERFNGLADAHRSNSFLFVGRYAPEKGLDVLLKAYERYSKAVDDPWPLDCVGAGTLRSQLFPAPERRIGRGLVRDLGFKQPDELAEVFATHGAFVLPSRFEPWGVVLAEAAGAGLPLICTDACGARCEVLRPSGPETNGFVVRAGSVRSLAEAMIHLHRLGPGTRARMAMQSRKLAAPYSASAWAERTERIANDLLERYFGKWYT